MLRSGAVVVLAVVTALFPIAAAAQNADRSPGEIIVADLEIFASDAVGFFAAPLSFHGRDFERLLAGTGALAVTFAMDEPLNDLLVMNPPPEGWNDALRWGEEWGRLRTMQIASLGVYIGGLATGEDGIRVTGRLMGEALLLAGVPAITLQYVLGRSRPYAGEGAFQFNFFEWDNEQQSFPSGHATVAFAISTVLAKRIDRWWASVPLYGSAGLTVLTLAWHNQHWASDLFAGAALGYLAGSFVTGKEEARSAGGSSGARRDGGSFIERLDAGVGIGSISLRYRFD